MSHIGSLVVSCVAPSAMPERLDSFDDLGRVPLDPPTSVLVLSRNAWINHQIEDLARSAEVSGLPTSQAPALVADAESLRALAAGLKGLLQRVQRSPLALPPGTREMADEADLQRCSTLAPASLQEALSTWEAAQARDEECEAPETLVALLWCMLHLAEHAVAHDLCFVCVRSP